MSRCDACGEPFTVPPKPRAGWHDTYCPECIEVAYRKMGVKTRRNYERGRESEQANDEQEPIPIGRRRRSPLGVAEPVNVPPPVVLIDPRGQTIGVFWPFVGCAAAFYCLLSGFLPVWLAWIAVGVALVCMILAARALHDAQRAVDQIEDTYGEVETNRDRKRKLRNGTFHDGFR